jgi:hypothetical protein
MEQEGLCTNCKSGYMKSTDKPRRMICSFCGRSELTLTLGDIAQLKRTGQI